MDRKMINDVDLEGVTGGSIMISEDGTTCGRNCDNQYKILNMSALLKFVKENKTTMSERKMLSEMVNLGYIANL